MPINNEETAGEENKPSDQMSMFVESPQLQNETRKKKKKKKVLSEKLNVILNVSDT